MIQHNRPTVGIEELTAIDDVIKSGMLSQGKNVECFENEMCELLGVQEGCGVATSSGSASLYLAIRSIVEKKKIETVAIPAFSCSALKNAVNLANLKANYVDVEIGTPGIDLKSPIVEKSDIAIAAHMFGMPIGIEDESIIEDCAQSIGATINGAPVGSQTSISIFSFYATKPITSAGEGGMVICKDKRDADFIRDIRDFDMKNDNILRFNFQMTDIQAAFGRVQLKKLDRLIARRKYLADRYEEKGIMLWNRFPGCIDYRGIIKSNNPRNLISFLAKKGIESIIPIEESELLCKKENVPNAYVLTQSLVSIPLYPSLSENEQDYIVECLMEYADREGSI